MDVAVDQGGCVETIHPTTHGSPVYTIDDVVHYGVANMPGAVALTSTLALTGTTLGYGLYLADNGLEAAACESRPIATGVNTYDGHITCRGVSEGMIRQRLKRLRESDVLKVAAGIDPDALENQQAAMVAVNVAKASLLETKAREIADLPHVLAVSIVSGRYDLMAEVLVDSNHGLVDFLTGELSEVGDITASESFLLLKSYGKYIQGLPGKS